MKKTILILSKYNSSDALFNSYVFSHSKALAEQGNRVIVFVITNFFPFIKPKVKMENKIVDGVDIRYYNTIGFSNFLYNSKINLNGYSYYFVAKRKLKKLLKIENIDLIDAHTFKNEGYAAALLKKKFNIKTFVTLHGTSFNRNFLTKNGKEQIKWVGNIIDSYVCVSNKIYKQLGTLNIKNKKIIYNGINSYKIKRKNEKYNICTLGNLIGIKNIDIVIQAFEKIAKKYSQSRLYIIGDGPLKEELIDLTKKLNIEKQVVFLGKISNEEVYKYFSKCNIFCLLSKPEGFGIAYLEAMYSGCIPIGTKGEGIDGFIKNKQNGFLINIEANKLSKLFIEILDGNFENIRQSAINTAKEQTWPLNAKEYISLLEDVYVE